MSFFRLEKKDAISRARAGILQVRGHRIPTPVFMPVGTLGTVKSIPQEVLVHTLQAPILLANAYHLYLRPGLEVLQAAGGLSRFMGWPHALLTDSGGYQVFSLAARRKITEEGVRFRSHIDGSSHLFTPESVMDVQHVIGADIVMPLDDCLPYPVALRHAAQSLSRTHRWLLRCLARHEQHSSAVSEAASVLFPIIQGGGHHTLRKQAVASVLEASSWDGYAIGGLSVGEPADLMYEITAHVVEQLPEACPRYLMGVGRPENILHTLAHGVDMFDCVLPTRNARNGMLFTTAGVLNILNKKWQKDMSPLDGVLAKQTGNTYSRYTKAYLRHLFVSKEMLGPQVASVQNLLFYRWLMREARKHIVQGSFSPWMKNMLPQISGRL